MRGTEARGVEGKASGGVEEWEALGAVEAWLAGMGEAGVPAEEEGWEGR